MLGSRKLLIVLCIVPCLLFLVCIGAFAAPAYDVTPSVDLPLETELVEDVVKSPSYVAEETFPAEPLLESSYYSYSLGFNDLAWYISNAASCYSFSVVDSNGSYICGGGGGEAQYLAKHHTTDGYGIMYGSTFYLVGNSFTGLTVNFTSPSSSLTISGVTYQGTLVEESLVPDIADSVFSLGDALITFVVSSWVVMIPLAAWLVVLCIGAIRKLIKGV